MKRSLKKGLPGGPNEKVFSKEGYRSTSPDVNNLFNFIPSGNITMKEKDGTPLKKGPLLGIDNLGNSKLMLPGANYQFPGDVVKEVPLAKKGGPFQNSNIYATNKLFAKNPLFKKRKKGKKAKGIYNPKAKYTYDDGGESGCPDGKVWSNKFKKCVHRIQHEDYFNSPSMNNYGDVPVISSDPIQSLGDLGPDGLMENILEFFDPSGALSYDDAQKAYNEWQNSKNTSPTFDQSLSMFGAVPALGKLGKIKYLKKGLDKFYKGFDLSKAVYGIIPWQKILNAIDTGQDINEDNINPSIKKTKKSEWNPPLIKREVVVKPKKAFGGEAACPEGFYNDPVKGCVAIEDPSTFYENWYKNRVMPTAEGQKLLEKIRPEALERASQNVPYIYSEELNPDEAGYYDTETQQIILNKDLPEAQIEATKLHERGHHIQAGDKFYDVLGKPHQYLVEQNVVGPKEIDTGNPEWDKNLKKNYEDVTNPDEMHARIMTLRNECGFKPDQVITEKDIEDCFKRKKEAGEALDPDIEDLKGVTKGNKSIVNLLNDMVSVPTSQDGMLYAKNGGAIEIEIDEADIDKYVKGGYIVEDISVPSLTRMQFAGEVPDSTYTPIDPNFLAENPDTYSKIVNKPEVTTERQGSDIGKLRAEFREKNPMDIFLDEKKRQFLKKNKGLNKAAGNTMEKFPEDVLQNFINEYDYKTNTYAVNKLGKKEGWNPKRRGEWVDELTPGERDAVAESKYGSKLQPSYWSRSLAGLQELGNEAIKLLPGEQGDVMKFNIPGLTKKEQKEIRESKLGALETLAPMDIPGAAIANLAKNTGLSTGSDYKEQANALAGEKMANVSDTDAMALNPLTYAGLESLPELGVNLAKGLGKGANKLQAFVKNARDMEKIAKAYSPGLTTMGYSASKPAVNFVGPMRAPADAVGDVLTGLRKRGTKWDQAGAKGEELLHSDMINYHGTYSGRPIVEIKMPDGTPEFFYKSSGWAGKSSRDGKTTAGMWQPFGGFSDLPKTKDWFVKDASELTVDGIKYKTKTFNINGQPKTLSAFDQLKMPEYNHTGRSLDGYELIDQGKIAVDKPGYELYYGSKAYKGMAENLDNALMQKLGFQNTDELDNAFNFKNRNANVDSYTPIRKYGGIVSELTKKEIDKLIKQGYIIEEID